MKKIFTLTTALILTLSALMLASCGKSEFNAIGETEKRIMTANVQKTDSATAEFAAGSYLVKATCLEEATGTVVVEAKAS